MQVREARRFGLNKVEFGLHTDLINKRINVLITSGAGYVGTELLTKLAIINEISKIIVYNNLSRGHRSLFFRNKSILFIKIVFVHGEILGLMIIKKTIE